MFCQRTVFSTVMYLLWYLVLYVFKLHIYVVHPIYVYATCIFKFVVFAFKLAEMLEFKASLVDV
jgi:hypothetical protein